MIYSPGLEPRTVRAPNGQVLKVPENWQLLLPGDAALTRRVKLAGESWLIQEKRGRKTFSRGLWAPADTITRIQQELVAERATEGYAKRQVAAVRRREKVQTAYTEDFFGAILAFLNFHPQYDEFARLIARAVTDHATPVGSGTVARTQRIPIERRAEAAVIAWMRHQTTGYDSMHIARVAGQRREVRQQLAQKSRELLERYRRGDTILKNCPLRKALAPNS